MNTTPMHMVIPAALLLAACTPTSSDAANASTSAGVEVATASPPSSKSPPQVPAEVVETSSSDAPATGATSASISGAIRDGNRAPPGLRVCATPVEGGAPTCIDTAQGARAYRIEVTPGRYYLLGWAQSGELALIAHASQIRCIRAPCPPDELIEVTVVAGEQREGIDLNGGYPDIPDGWPKRPD